jgi:hypothetical protein
VYDTLMGLPFLGWVLASTLVKSAGLIQYVNVIPVDSSYAIHMAMRLSTIAFLALLVTAVLFRTRPTAKASGLDPRISGVGRHCPRVWCRLISAARPLGDRGGHIDPADADS